MAETTCAVFEPTEAEFSNFRAYIEGIEKNYRGIGICKIIPPSTWFVQNYDISKMNFVVKHPLKQQAVGRNGMYSLKLVETKPKTIQKFYEYAQSTEFVHENYHIRERKFWQALGRSGIFDDTTNGGPIYGADVEGTLFTHSCTFPTWDLRNLDNHLSGLKPDIPGVSTPMLYVGSWSSLFAYHVEDLDLYSINYLHTGAAKSWYSIAPSNRKRLESLAQCYFRQEYEFECKEFLRHKNKMISPSRLKSDGIDFQTVVQHAGEFVVTFPGAYHAGFNHGFNIAEATNFALPRWFDIGRKAGICLCTPDTVRIDVDVVETRYLRECQRMKQQEQEAANLYFQSDDNTTEQVYRIRCLCLARRTFTPTEHNPIIRDEHGRFTFYETDTTPNRKGEIISFELRCCQTCALWFHTQCVQDNFVDQEMKKFSCHVCQRIELEEAQYCQSTSSHSRGTSSRRSMSSGGSTSNNKKMLLLTPPTTAATQSAMPKKKPPVIAKPQPINVKLQPLSQSNFVDLTASPPTASSSSSSSGNGSGHAQSSSNHSTVNTAVAATTNSNNNNNNNNNNTAAVAGTSHTVLEVGYRRNQVVSILLPRHVQPTTGMLVSIEGELGRLHVKGDPKANDIWVNLADCYVVNDSSSSTVNAYAPKKKAKTNTVNTKKRKLGYEASINKALRLSIMNTCSSNVTNFTRSDDSLYFDESEVYDDHPSALGSIPFEPLMPQADNVKMEVNETITGSHWPPLVIKSEDDGDEQSLRSCSDALDESNDVRTEVKVQAIPALDFSFSLPAVAAATVAMSTVKDKEVIDLTASNSEDEDDDQKIIPVRVADLL